MQSHGFSSLVLAKSLLVTVSQRPEIRLMLLEQRVVSLFLRMPSTLILHTLVSLQLQPLERLQPVFGTAQMLLSQTVVLVHQQPLSLVKTLVSLPLLGLQQLLPQHFHALRNRAVLQVPLGLRQPWLPTCSTQLTLLFRFSRYRVELR